MRISAFLSTRNKIHYRQDGHPLSGEQSVFHAVLAYVSQQLKTATRAGPSYNACVVPHGIIFFFLATYSIDEHLILLPEAPDWFLTAPQPFSSYGSLSRNTVIPVPKIPRICCCCVRRASSAALTCCRSWIALQKFDFIEAYPGLDDWVDRRLLAWPAFRWRIPGPLNSTCQFKSSSDENCRKSCSDFACKFY